VEMSGSRVSIEDILVREDILAPVTPVVRIV
jgi:hypothetical protein